jgi:uncharacterized OsmC-like protein
MSETAVQPEANSQVVYRSEVRVELQPGAIKSVFLPVESEPVPMGIHGAIARHYKVPDGAFTPHAATLDFLVGSTAGCLMGTLARALVARKIPVDSGRLTADAVGEIEAENGVLVVRRIRVLVHLRADSSQQETAERVIGVYAEQCPMHQSIRKAIDITTELDFQPAAAV